MQCLCPIFLYFFLSFISAFDIIQKQLVLEFSGRNVDVVSVERHPSIILWRTNLHCPSKKEWADAEAPLCERCSQRGRWLHSFLHIILNQKACGSQTVSNSLKMSVKQVCAPAAMAPTSGTKHIWTGLHQFPAMNTTPSGSLTTRHSSSDVDWGQ